jgi:hypothetical protein
MLGELKCIDVDARFPIFGIEFDSALIRELHFRESAGLLVRCLQIPLAMLDIADQDTVPDRLQRGKPFAVI